MKCSKFESCSFTHCETNFKLLESIDHCVEDFCLTDDHGRCIRLQLEEKNGPLHVPTNMMPNGLPLPGTHRRDWTSIAIEYKKHI